MSNVQAHESSRGLYSQVRPKAVSVRKPGADGFAMPLSPATLLYLQRTAGNAAVTSMLTIQRKKTPEYTDGQIQGVFTYMDDKSAPRQAMITVTDAWFA